MEANIKSKELLVMLVSLSLSLYVLHYFWSRKPKLIDMGTHWADHVTPLSPQNLMG
jgi:hypothetical protein